MLDNKLPEWATDVTGNRMCRMMQLAYNDYGQHDHSQLQLLAVTLYVNVEAVLFTKDAQTAAVFVSLTF